MEHKEEGLLELDQEQAAVIPKEESKLKSVDYTNVSERSIADLASSISKLAEVKIELEKRMIEAITKNEEIKKRLESLETAGVIQIDHEQSKHFEQSIKTYLGLLYNITQELTEEIEFFKPFFATPRPATIQIPEQSNFDAADFVKVSAEAMRRHAKTVNKGMVVSYSRYGYSLDSQLKQLSILEKRK